MGNTHALTRQESLSSLPCAATTRYLLTGTSCDRTTSGFMIDFHNVGIINIVPEVQKIFNKDSDMATVSFNHSSMLPRISSGIGTGSVLTSWFSSLQTQLRCRRSSSKVFGTQHVCEHYAHCCAREGLDRRGPTVTCAAESGYRLSS